MRRSPSSWRPGPPRAFAIAKELLNQAAGWIGSTRTWIGRSTELARVADGAEFAEGLAAFFEKRPPVFVRQVDGATCTNTASFRRCSTRSSGKARARRRDGREARARPDRRDRRRRHRAAAHRLRSSSACIRSATPRRSTSKTVAARWTCPAGHGDIARGRRLRCPPCARPARLAAGDEIVLDQLELEVP